MKLTLQGIKDVEAFEKAGIVLPSYDVDAVIAKTKEAPIPSPNTAIEICR